MDPVSTKIPKEKSTKDRRIFSAGLSLDVLYNNLKNIRSFLLICVQLLMSVSSEM